MAFDRDGLSTLWDRIRLYVAAYVAGHSSSMDVATVDDVGVVKPDGTTITIDRDGTIHGADQTQVATTTVAGKVKPDGTSITIDQDGTIHGAVTYELPDATGTVKGGVSVDTSNGLTISGGRLGVSVASESGRGVVSIAEDGAITSDQGAIDVRVATDGQTGVVRPDGETITIDDDGTIHGTDQVQVATTEVAGKVRPDGEYLSMFGDVISLVGDTLTRTSGEADFSRVTEIRVSAADDVVGIPVSSPYYADVSLSDGEATRAVRVRVYGDTMLRGDVIRLTSSGAVASHSSQLIWFGPGGYESRTVTDYWNVVAWTRHREQAGLPATERSLVAYAVSKAAELSGDLTMSTEADANAWFSSHPYHELLPLADPLEYELQAMGSLPTSGTWEVTGVSLSYADPTAPTQDPDFGWEVDEVAIGYPTASDTRLGVAMADGETIEADGGVLSVSRALLAQIADLRRRVAALEGVSATVEDGYLTTSDPVVDGYLESGGTMADGYLTY